MISSKFQTIIGTIITLALVYTVYVVFMVVPNEQIMGAVQRIFYFHVGSAIACYTCLFILFISSLWYLATNQSKADALNVSAGEVGLLFCTVVLVSGMIWGNAAWNTWFRFEPRLVTFLILWFIMLGFNIHRKYAEFAYVRGQSAVLGIISALNVPLVITSIKFLPQSHQLHPQVVSRQGLEASLFVYGMVLSMITLVCFALYLIWIRYNIQILEDKLNR